MIGVLNLRQTPQQIPKLLRQLFPAANHQAGEQLPQLAQVIRVSTQVNSNRRDPDPLQPPQAGQRHLAVVAQLAAVDRLAVVDHEQGAQLLRPGTQRFFSLAQPPVQELLRGRALVAGDQRLGRFAGLR